MENIYNFFQELYQKIIINEYNIDDLNVQELEIELQNYSILQASAIYSYDDSIIIGKIMYINNLINEKKKK